MAINKPLTVDLDNLSWGAMEDLEEMDTKRKAGVPMKSSDVINLCSSLLSGWTREDFRAVTIGETEEIFLALRGALLKEIPKASTTPLSPPLSTVDQDPLGSTPF